MRKRVMMMYLLGYAAPRDAECSLSALEDLVPYALGRYDGCPQDGTVTPPADAFDVLRRCEALLNGTDLVAVLQDKTGGGQ